MNRAQIKELEHLHNLPRTPEEDVILKRWPRNLMIARMVHEGGACTECSWKGLLEDTKDGWCPKCTAPVGVWPAWRQWP